MRAEQTFLHFCLKQQRTAKVLASAMVEASAPRQRRVIGLRTDGGTTLRQKFCHGPSCMNRRKGNALEYNKRHEFVRCIAWALQHVCGYHMGIRTDPWVVATGRGFQGPEHRPASDPLSK